jgi:CRP/FNR family transcriptional regulator, nitrogen fixation regulation protein
MLQTYTELKTGLEYRQRLHEVRGTLSDAAPVFVDSEDDPKFAIKSILALRCGPVHHQRNKMIFIEGDPTEYIFLLVDGVVRTCRSFNDGSRCIVCFHISGELFGFNGEPTHSLSAEAATNTTMLLLKRSSVLAMAARDSRVAKFLLANTTKELRRLQEHAVLISRNAQCRVATFLIDLSMRMGKTEYLNLPMPHYDIADYLGLKIETVSRVITEFERSGFVARASNRTLILKNRTPLMRMMT